MLLVRSHVASYIREVIDFLPDLVFEPATLRLLLRCAMVAIEAPLGAGILPATALTLIDLLLMSPEVFESLDDGEAASVPNIGQ